jgi:hypothetical protein
MSPSSFRWAQDEVAHEFAEELARRAVAQQAPHELPLFRATALAYREAHTDLRYAPSRDELLGFGPEVAVALAPFALAIGNAVVTFLAEQVLAVGREEGEHYVQDSIRRWLRRLRASRGDEATAATSLNREQLARVRAVALEKGRQLELPDGHATLLADAIVGALSDAV